MLMHGLAQLESKLLAILCFAAALNALLPSVFYTVEDAGFLGGLLEGLGHSYVIWLCLFLALKLALNTRAYPARLMSMQWLSALALSALLLIPSAMLSWLVCIALCFLWGRDKRASRDIKIASLILIAVAIRDPICQTFLHLFAEQILSFDAWVSGIVLLLINNSVVISGNTITQSDGHSLLILTGCSAFTNLSLALLLWFSFTLDRHKKLINKDYFYALLLITLLLGMNSIRLAFMAINHDWYQLLHEGNSQEAIEFMTIIISLLCIRRNSSHEKPINKKPANKKPADHKHVDHCAYRLTYQSDTKK